MAKLMAVFNARSSGGTAATVANMASGALIRAAEGQDPRPNFENAEQEVEPGLTAGVDIGHIGSQRFRQRQQHPEEHADFDRIRDIHENRSGASVAHSK
ncbi:MAG: hypothetical protein NT069_03165 [Planctomycetota bacterium]|nr:hypothetical protein [Planctomycetota bacterium]